MTNIAGSGESIFAFMAPRLATLPGPQARAAAGLLLADSVICAMAATETSRIATLLETTAAGTPARLAASADAVNLLDADDTLLNGSHFGGLLSVVGLNEAARAGATWGKLREAVAVGFECNARLNLALASKPGFLSPGIMLPGAIVTAALLRGAAGRAALRRALSIAHRFMPAPISRDEALGEPSMLKYGPYGQLAVSAALVMDLATCGYEGAEEYAFLSPRTLAVQQLELAAPGILFEPAGPWWIEETSFKPYPTFRAGHPVLDAMGKLCAAGLPQVTDVSEVRIWLDPRALRLPFHAWPLPEARDELLPVKISMNLRLATALVATGIPPGAEWSDGSWLGDTAVASWFERMVIDPAPAITADELTAAADPRSGRSKHSFGKVRVTLTDGTTREAAADRASGDPWFAETRPDRA